MRERGVVGTVAVLKAAVVGTGSMGRNHLRVYGALAGVALVGIVDSDPSTASEVSRACGVPGYADLGGLLAGEKPDLVSVAVPTAHHFAVVRELLVHGVHVLVEKPIASTVEQGERLVELAASKSVVLAVGHIERFNPVIVALKRRLAKGMSGPVYQLRASRLSPVPARSRESDVVINLASHDIDLMRHLVGQPIERAYGEALRSAGSDREDMFAGTLRFRGGTIGVLEANRMTPVKTRRLTVTCAGGVFECDLLGQVLSFHASDAALRPHGMRAICGDIGIGWQELGVERGESLAAELRDFVDAVQCHRRPAVDGADGLETLRVARALLESGRQVRSVPRCSPAGNARRSGCR